MLACHATAAWSDTDAGAVAPSAAQQQVSPADEDASASPPSGAPQEDGKTAPGARIGQTGDWQAGQPLSPGQALARDFGAIGLTAEINSEEYFGALQARLGAYTALPTTATHPDLSLQNIVVPAHLTLPLTGDGRWFIKIGAAGIKSWGDSHGDTLETTTTVTSQAELQFHPRPGTLIGLGATYETNSIDLAGGGHISVPGPGVRFDLLQRIGQHLGFAAKIEWMDGTTTTTIPLGPGLRLRDKAGSPRTYVQLGLIGMIQHKDAAFIPDGWSIRPMAHLILQRTALGASTNSLGVFVPRDHQDFGEVMLSTRLQKDVFRSGQIGPFVELGAEVQIDDRIPTPASDPTLGYAKVGAYMRVGGWGFLDGYYAYRDAFNGQYRAGTAELLLSVTL